jgi:hypothetical protein
MLRERIRSRSGSAEQSAGGRIGQGREVLEMPSLCEREGSTNRVKAKTRDRLPPGPYEVPGPRPAEIPTRPDIPHRLPEEYPTPTPWEPPEPEPEEEPMPNE